MRVTFLVVSMMVLFEVRNVFTDVREVVRASLPGFIANSIIDGYV
jgi:hypothetical protein